MFSFIISLVIALQWLILADKDIIRSKLQQATFDWGYSSSNGPRTWAQYFPKCAGKLQSPINLNLLSVSNRNLGLIFEGFEAPLADVEIENLRRVNIYNNPKKIGSAKQTVTGSAVNGNRYRFYESNFHWGQSNNFGTEHALLGKRYALEFHTVLLNVKYEGIADMKARLYAYHNNADGVLTLAVLYKATLRDNPLFTQLLNCIEKIKCQGDTFITSFDASLLSFFPKTLGNFYKYHGSFVTPPCSEVVTWVVFKQTMTIGVRQLSRFRQLRGKGCREAVVCNIRNLQPANGRAVEKSF